MKNATFRQWRVFSEVARHLSFVRAAATLHLTPPAVTQQVKELKDMWACRCSPARVARFS